MVGLRGMCWVGCWALLALACGRTASADEDETGNGARSAAGGTGNGVTTGGSGPTSHAGTTGEAGEIGAAGAPAECPATPIAGRWVARGPDPYGLHLKNDGVQVTGEGCIGGFAPPDESSPFGCNPLNVLADTGRRFEFTWDAGPSVGVPYVMKMQLTLSPERNAMAGKMWSTYAGVDGEGLDIVFVPYPGEPTLPATSCSGGEPSGACFLAPLRTDRIEQLRVVELSNGDLLMLWLNRRGVGKRVAAARFDAALGTWQPAAFLDDGSAPVDSPLVSTSTGGWAMAVYTQGDALMARVYSPKTKAWSEQQVVTRAQAADQLHPSGLFVYDGGSATVVASTQPLDGGGSLSAYDYSGSWAPPHILEASPENAYQWAAGSDATHRELVIWVRGGRVDKPHELWFSSRTAASDWSTPALFVASDKQILRPALAIGKDGAAIATWQEWVTRIASSAYSFDTNTWSESLTITSESQIDNHELRFDAAGQAVAYLDNSGTTFPYGELKSVLSDTGWGTPEVSSEQEASGATYEVMGANPLQVTRIQPLAGANPLPGLERSRCEGY